MYSDKRTKAEEEVALIFDEDSEPEQRSWRTTAPQILVTMVQGMQILSFGMLIAVPTVVIGALYNSTGKLSMDGQQASWFAGLLLINQPVGSLLSGFLQESLGRKKCMLLVNVPELAAWVRLYTAQSMITIYMSAVLMGFCCGFLTPTLSYLGEVCQPHLRGRMVSLTGVFLASGHLLVYLLGAVKDWRTLSAVCSSVPILTTIFIFQIPESPVWLVINGKDEEAKTALAWLRGWVSTENIMMEFESLKDHICSKHQNIVIHNDGNYYSPVPVSETEAPAVVVEKSQWGETISCLTRAEMLRPLRVTVLFFFFYCCAAITGSRAYLVVIFKMLHTNVDPFLGPVIAVICLIMGTVICILCIRKVGKRKLSLLSMTCCSLFTSIFGAYAYLHQTNGLMIPLFPEILYCCLYFFTNLGIGIIPWVLISEVFPPRGKGLGGGIAAASYYCFWFLTSKSFLFLESLISLSGVYFFYSGLGVCGIAFVYFYLPETESKTLAEVEEIFKTKKLDNSKKRKPTC